MQQLQIPQSTVVLQHIKASPSNGEIIHPKVYICEAIRYDQNHRKRYLHSLRHQTSYSNSLSSATNLRTSLLSLILPHVSSTADTAFFISCGPSLFRLF